MLRKLFRKQASVAPAVPEGQRVYAIGDVHGRHDLLQKLLHLIEEDDRRRGDAQTTLIFLGDLIDRGPESAAVVETLRSLAQRRPATRFLLGNHEEVFLSAIDGDRRALRGFCRIGGSETLFSYGVSPSAYERMSFEEVAEALAELVPPAHVAFLASFEDLIVVGDYAFVHAGIDPASPLDAQEPNDLRWIRNPFLDHRRPFEKVIVHGHTIRPDVEWRENRIGIDTGAYETDRLTALALEGTERWLLQT